VLTEKIQVAGIWRSRTQLRHLSNSSLQPETLNTRSGVLLRSFLCKQTARQEGHAQEHMNAVVGKPQV
jgi:hypothetical protein